MFQNALGVNLIISATPAFRPASFFQGKRKQADKPALLARFCDKLGQSMENVLAILLAGGRGERLDPLTRDRAKPAVSFGGNYRIIDITLSNCINSGLRRMLILTQYKAQAGVD